MKASVHRILHNIGDSLYGKCRSQIPCIPGIRVTWHSVTILGMEPLSTLYCPYVTMSTMITMKLLL